MTPPKAAAFLARDWGTFDDALDDHVAQVHREGGAAALVAMADALRARVRAARPDWPTPADRARDRRHHLKLIAILDRVPSRSR